MALLPGFVHLSRGDAGEVGRCDGDQLVVGVDHADAVAVSPAPYFRLVISLIATRSRRKFAD
jgi:hypothetical protein